MWRTAIAALISGALAGCASPQLISSDGQLADCSLPRCVSSGATDPDRRVEPLRYEGSRESARLALLRIIGSMEGAKLVEQREDYIHAEFTTRVMRYVDDLELLFPRGERLVQLRSSSRLGYYDFDTNRERVEAIRAQFDAVQP